MCSTLRVIVDHGCLAAAPVELSPTSTLGVGAISSSLFQGGVSALEMSAMRLVDGAGSGISNNGDILAGSRSGGPVVAVLVQQSQPINVWIYRCLTSAGTKSQVVHTFDGHGATAPTTGRRLLVRILRRDTPRSCLRVDGSIASGGEAFNIMMKETIGEGPTLLASASPHSSLRPASRRRRSPQRIAFQNHLLLMVLLLGFIEAYVESNYTKS
ncbi:hypothetical protein Tco_0488013 [Tanacetum coccineum]